MKHLRKLVMILCLVFVMVGGFSTTTEAAVGINLTSIVQSTNQIKLKWKKQKGVKGYKIYRDTYCSKGNYKRELIATLGEKKTSFIDKNVKANQEYEYTMHAYYYENGKEKNMYEGVSGLVSTSAKLAEPIFDEPEYRLEGIYNYVKTTSNQIKIAIGAIGIEEESAIEVDAFGRFTLKPDGIEVFKKIGKKYISYKKIKIKKKKIYYFTDNNVEQGKKYKYKFRTYKKVNGKTIYSPKTNAFTVCAMNNNPSIDFSVSEPFDSKEKTMTVCIVNNEDYGSLTDFCDWNYSKNAVDSNYVVYLKAISYSYDNATWNTDMKAFKVKPGQKVYIKFVAKEESLYGDKPDENDFYESMFFFMRHKFYHYSFNYDISENIIEMRHYNEQEAK